MYLSDIWQWTGDGESSVPGVNAQHPVVEHTVVVIALVTIRPLSTVEKIVQEVTRKLRYVTTTHAQVSYIIPINPLKRFN